MTQYFKFSLLFFTLCLSASIIKTISLFDCTTVEQAEQLIKEGADVNARDDVDQTPLHCNANPEIIQLLIDAGAAVNAQDTFGNTPLHTQNNHEIIKLLIKNGANITIENKFKGTPADYNQTPEKIAELILAGIDYTNLNHAFMVDPMVKRAIHYIQNLKPATIKLFYNPQSLFINTAKKIYVEYFFGEPEILENTLEVNPRFKELFKPKFVKQVAESKKQRLKLKKKIEIENQLNLKEHPFVKYTQREYGL